MKPDLLLSELQKSINDEFQIEVSERTIVREMKCRGLTYKKVFYQYLTMAISLKCIIASESGS
jgi:transposase